MGEKSNVLKTSVSIKYNDVFSMKDLYNFVRDWLIDENYVVEGDDDKWMETYYYENISQLSGKEMVVYWRTSKMSQSKFIKLHLHIDYRVLAMKDVETTVKGKKVKANKGEVEIIITGFMEFDPKSDFAKDKILSKPVVMDFWKKRLYKSNIEEVKKLFIGDIKDLQEKIKIFLEAHPTTSEETFRPKRGL